VPEVYVYALALSTGGNENSLLMKNGGSPGDDEILKTDNNGAYTLGGLRNDSYLVLFHRDDYLSVFYGDAFTWEIATALNLTGNTNLTDINISIVKMDGFGGKIAGSVFTSGNSYSPSNILSSSLISVRNGSDDVIATAISDHNGYYIVPAVTNGIYTLKASHIGYVTTEYSKSVQIDLSNSPVVSGIDIEVPLVPSAVGDNDGQNPETFNLYQNFPNPFNPATNIGFTISDFGFVSLKVYDVLGNEIATLVNEEKQAGNYNVEFGKNLIHQIPSGIYFYRLTAGSFVATKKMILLK